jgi:BSD domain
MFLTDPTEEDFPSWETTFSADAHTEEIATELDLYPVLRKQMDSLVPEQVPYATFWSRYFFRSRLIVESERRRRELLFAARDEDNEFDWDEEEEEEGKMSGDTVVKSPGAKGSPRKSSTSESSTSFDVVSMSSAVQLAQEKVSRFKIGLM